MRELAGQYDLREVIYDPWRFGQAAQELERERVIVTAFPQTDARMNPASDRLYRAVTEQTLTVRDHGELRAQVANTIAKPPAAAGASMSAGTDATPAMATTTSATTRPRRQPLHHLRQHRRSHR